MAAPADEPYAVIWTGIAPEAWQRWRDGEFAHLYEDYVPDVYTRRRPSDDGPEPEPHAIFKRQVAHLFRMQLGYFDVQCGFNDDLRASINAGGPRSRIVIMCRDDNVLVPNDALRATYGAWHGCGYLSCGCNAPVGIAAA